MIKGLLKKEKGVRMVTYAGGEKTLAIHPSIDVSDMEDDSVVEFTIEVSWVDLHMVYYAMLSKKQHRS